MDKLFFAAVSSTAPVATGYVNGNPTDGDPTTGVGATEPGAYWFYMITMELLNLISGAGITFNGAVLTQVFAAVQAIANTAAAAAQSAAISAATSLAAAARTGAVSDVVALFTGSNASYTANGWQVLPGGGIRNWTSQAVVGAANTTVTVTYAKPFTTFSAIPVPSVVDPARSGDESNFLGLSVVSYSLTGCVIAMGQNGGGARNVTLGTLCDGK
jgi:hypothetical protein